MKLDPAFSLGGHLATALSSACNVSNPTHFVSNEDGMRLALIRAMQTSGLSDPNPTVGCIVSKNGHVIATGSSQAVGGLHAERVALNTMGASTSAQGSTLFTTLEPCSHTGAQPPCCERIIEAGVTRCVVGVQDSNPVVNGKGIAWLRAAGIEVTTNVLQSECAAWHLPFLLRAKLKRPIIAAKWGQTLDGQLAFDSGTPQWITGKTAKRYAHWLRQRYDGIVIGAGTAINDLPRLTVRHAPFSKHRNPVRVVLDPNNRILSSGKWQRLLGTIFNEESKVVLICSKPVDVASKQRMDHLRSLDHIVARCIEPQENLIDKLFQVASESSVISQLGRPLNSLLIEGGPRLHSLFFRRNLVDVSHILIAPIIGGGAKHRIVSCAERSLRMSVTGTYTLGEDILVEMVGAHATQFFSSASGFENQISIQGVAHHG